MTEETKKVFTPRGPDFGGDGVAVWVEKDKNGKTYFVVKKPEWAKGVPCFKIEPKPKPQEEKEF